MKMDQSRSGIRRRQAGSTLLIAVLLLLLAGLMTIAAMNVGLFEQRSTGNDIRAKAVNDVAEAGLAQGFEFLMRQNPDMLQPGSTWVKCLHGDVKFPCGAASGVDADLNGDGTAAAGESRRSTLYRLVQSSQTITGLDNALANYMLTLPSSSKIATAAAGGTVAYGVAPLMCFVERPDPTDPSTTPLQCGDGTGATSTELRIVTFVSVAKIPGESASATVIQTLGQYPKLNDPVGKPPITASGALDVTGGLQVVTNPNAGGPGVPISVWTRRDITKTGTTNTCYADEFFRYTQGNVNPTNYQGTIRCDDCKCDANGAPNSISYDSSGNVQVEGMDILDVEGTSAQDGSGANLNVRSDAASYPLCEFPPDLFNFVFGTKVWDDANDDCFGETKLSSVNYTNPDNGVSALVGRDEDWLYTNADKIIYAAANEALVRTAAKEATSALLSDPDAQGIIWCQTGCDIGSGDQVGTPDHPVLLVLDGPVSIQGTVFGMVFVRDTGNTLNADTGSSGSGNCPNNCAVQMNAGAAIYGALVLQGQMKANGTSAVVHDASVLRRLQEQGGITPASLPGAWTDRVSY